MASPDQWVKSNTDFIVRTQEGSFRLVAWLEPYDDGSNDLHMVLQMKKPLLQLSPFGGAEKVTLNMFVNAQEDRVERLAGDMPRSLLQSMAKERLDEMVYRANLLLAQAAAIREARVRECNTPLAISEVAFGGI